MDDESTVRSMIHLSVTNGHRALYEESVAGMIRTLRAPYNISETESPDGDAITT